MPSFSVVVIARNEAHTLPRLVHSLAEFMRRDGEMLVVDTGSSDATVRRARESGCRVEEVGVRFETHLDPEQAQAIEGRFALNGEGPLVRAGDRLFNRGAARQHAASLAANDIVLHLDASDEAVALDVGELDAKLERERVGVFEYRLQQGGASWVVGRFYDRRLYHWEGRDHEGLYPNETADAPPASKVRCTDRDILIRHHRDEAKTRIFLPGLALDAMAHPERPRWMHYLGRELYYDRWFRSAISVLAEHASTPHAWCAERSQSLSLMGECLEALGQPGEAAESYVQAMAIDPTRREPLLRLAALCAWRGDFEGAAIHAAACLRLPRTSIYPELDANYTYLPHSLLYWSLFWLGRRDEARMHWDICRRLAPENPRFRDHARLFPATTVTRPAGS